MFKQRLSKILKSVDSETLINKRRNKKKIEKQTYVIGRVPVLLYIKDGLLN